MPQHFSDLFIEDLGRVHGGQNATTSPSEEQSGEATPTLPQSEPVFTTQMVGEDSGGRPSEWRSFPYTTRGIWESAGTPDPEDPR